MGEASWFRFGTTGRTRVRHNERTLTGRHLLKSRRAGLAVTGVVGAVCLLATACSGSSSPGTATGQHGSNGGTTTVSTSAAQVSINPANGSRNVKTGRGVSVTVAHGKIENVSVTDGHTTAV